ncbi:sodium/hydrogen exchanger 9B2-like [Schistocerca serialis cubense]|uniref:sodium/hydrogen exchanger 9B2-like n=1 Tax=Schistocerca serialis cubense TaxID=2023355 RepID=UPI00214EB98C|nr:sodium/hydrogen exchanger 9B2-like [Schistocerca serialis cubense]
MVPTADKISDRNPKQKYTDADFDGIERVQDSLLSVGINEPYAEGPSDKTDRERGAVTSDKQTRGCCRRYLEWLTESLHPVNLCPELIWPLKKLTALILLLLFWGATYTLIRNEIAPGGNIFTLLMLFLLAYIVGQLVSLIRLPPLLGMLLTGIAIRNLHLFNLSGVYMEVVSSLRKIAMTVILIKAGLGLDAQALKRLSLVVIRLAFIPCLFEASTVGLVSHYLLDFPWLWGFLLGFVLGAVSPAVVVPSLLHLQERGYGEDKGVATLVIAASSIDDIAAITGFGVILGFIFSEGNVTQQLLQGPLEVVLGLGFGIAWGVVSMYIPHRKDPYVVYYRAAMVAGGGIFAVFGSQILGYDGAGALACITAAFVACCGWKAQGWSAEYNPVSSIFSVIWEIFQPILFGLIGTEILISQLDGATVLRGMGVLFVGLLVRVCASCIATLGGALTLKEQLFVAIAWLPKATVQAALGPVALDIARKRGDASEDLASKLLTVAVLSILLTAPTGAVAIYISGPKLLNRVKAKYSSPIEEETNIADVPLHEIAAS